MSRQARDWPLAVEVLRPVVEDRRRGPVCRLRPEKGPRAVLGGLRVCEHDADHRRAVGDAEENQNGHELLSDRRGRKVDLKIAGPKRRRSSDEGAARRDAESSGAASLCSARAPDAIPKARADNNRKSHPVEPSLVESHGAVDAGHCQN